LNQEFPKQITKGFEEMKENLATDAFKRAGCGKSINVVITLKGLAYTWGKPIFTSYTPNYLE